MRPRFAKGFVLANAAFWVVFFLSFLAKSYPYEPHRPVFEEMLPSFVYFGRALPVHEELTGGVMRIARLVQKPSFVVSRPFFVPFNRSGIVVSTLTYGISLGGYYLLLVCGISFLQWSIAGILVDFIKWRVTGSPSK